MKLLPAMREVRPFTNRRRVSAVKAGDRRVAIVTAAAAGIGKAIALRWCREGGCCVMADTDGEGLDAAVHELAESGAAVCGVAGDVCLSDVANSVVERALTEFGRLDTLFNVVGGSLARNVEEISEEQWRSQIDMNLGSVFQMSKPVIPLLRQGGGGRSSTSRRRPGSSPRTGAPPTAQAKAGSCCSRRTWPSTSPATTSA